MGYTEADKKTMRILSAKIRAGQDLTEQEAKDYAAAESRYNAECAAHARPMGGWYNSPVAASCWRNDARRIER